ncbi:hypothetical protein [Moorena sp. SIOASIH]|nr:hypothetical protein [Moorena sp. SIOASIH]
MKWPSQAAKIFLLALMSRSWLVQYTARRPAAIPDEAESIEISNL